MRSTGTTISSSKPDRLNRAFQMPGSSVKRESGTRHCVRERRSRVESRGVEHDVGVGGERLLAGHASFGAQIDGLSSDEDDRTQFGASAVITSRSTRRASTYSTRG